MEISGQFKQAALIYNPFAGRLARASQSLQRTIDALKAQGIPARLVPTTGPNTASLIAREQLDAGCDLILAAGGDGTINEVANGMVHSRVPLAILPGGTANVLANEIRLPVHLEKSAKGLTDFAVTRIAVGKIQVQGSARRYFLLMAGVGLDAQIIYDLNLDLKAFAGKLAYYLGGFAQVIRPLPQFRAIVDGTEHKAGFALVSKVRNYGGDFEIAKEASLLRDDFQVVLFEATKSYQYLPYMAAMIAGRISRMRGCTFLRAQSVQFEPIGETAAHVQVDGEFAGRVPVSIDIVPDALTMLLPRSFVEREQRNREKAALATAPAAT